VKQHLPSSAYGWSDEAIRQESEVLRDMAQALASLPGEAVRHDLAADVLEAAALGIIDLPSPVHARRIMLEHLTVGIRLPTHVQVAIALRRANGQRRHRELLQRTPSWADMKAIAEVYEEARRLTRETGIEHVVDHAYPLRGELVSGLHVGANLRVITWQENSAKSNRFEVS
jgi:hypothetical protein